MRYLLFAQGPCPACGGDGWRLDDDKERCPECDGDGWKYSQVATIPEDEAENLVRLYGNEAIPFQGEPMPNREVSTRDYYGV